MLLTTLIFVGSLVITAANPISKCPPQKGAKGVRVRLPPWLTANSPYPPWQAPPEGWYFKPWSMFYATNPQYFPFLNLQYDPTPVDLTKPTGQVNDLFSFQLNNTIYTSYGIDTPDSRYSAVLNYSGTGIIEGATGIFVLIAWGCDISGAPYYASYSTATPSTNTPAGIDIMSTSAKGLDVATANALINELKCLPNKEIQELSAALRKTTQNGGRDGLGRISTCDDYCKSNKNLIAILG
ncbi:hypothetical protein GQ44DRAFT_715554 [Phaeosphaeriaceae sp. PMI808]|nr:hypothetical protein GQ44DRAFT_715554 [Phaeosphaeriaceae sp. PMI808]